MATHTPPNPRIAPRRAPPYVDFNERMAPSVPWCLKPSEPSRLKHQEMAQTSSSFSSRRVALCVSMYPQSLATFERTDRTSFADPQGSKSAPEHSLHRFPRPSAMFALCSSPASASASAGASASARGPSVPVTVPSARGASDRCQWCQCERQRPVTAIFGCACPGPLASVGFGPLALLGTSARGRRWIGR